MSAPPRDVARSEQRDRDRSARFPAPRHSEVRSRIRRLQHRLHAQGRTRGALEIHIGVEDYHWPGACVGLEMQMAVKDGKKIYRWTSEHLDIAVGLYSACVILPETRLAPEPVLVRCTGPGVRSRTTPQNIKPSTPRLHLCARTRRVRYREQMWVRFRERRGS